MFTGGFIKMCLSSVLCQLQGDSSRIKLLLKQLSYALKYRVECTLYSKMLSNMG